MPEASSVGPPGGSDGFVLHAKFSAYLGWSQPFLHSLIAALLEKRPGAVLCQRRENRERFPLDRYLAVQGRALAHPSLAVPLASCVQELWSPAIIHAHFGWSGVRSLLLQQALSVPMIVTFGGRDAGSELSSPRWSPIYRVLLEQTSAVIAVSAALRDELAAAGVAEGRLHLIRRGCELDFFQPIRRSDRDDPTVRFLMVGRLVEKKAHPLAIAALAMVRARGVDARLRIVGDGPGAETIAAEVARAGLSSEVVEIHAPTDRKGVRDHYGWADVLVHPSVRAEDGDEEGIPNVVVEAAATGLPIIGSRHGGIPETIRPGETGWLVPERNRDALADAMEEAARGAADRVERGAAGARLMALDFSHTSQLERHLALYDRVLAEPRSTPELPSDFHRDFLKVLTETGAVGRSDHRSLAVAEQARAWLHEAPQETAVGSELVQLLTGRERRGRGASARSAWSATKQALKRSMGALGARISHWRQQLHYSRVESRLRGIDDRVWSATLARRGALPAPTVRLAGRLRAMIREIQSPTTRGA